MASVQQISSSLRKATATTSIPSRGIALPLAALSFTQIVGWGSLLFMPAVLGRAIAADLGISVQSAFGAVSLMYVIGAVAAPAAGALIDRHGAAWVMACGSLAAAVGLATLSQVSGLAGYLFAWTLLGLTSAAGLSNAAYAALAQVAGRNTIRAVTVLMFATGLAGTISMPILHGLGGWLGWQGTCLLFALIHGLLCLPLHALTLRSGRAARAVENAPAALSQGWPAGLQRSAFRWLAIALALNIFVTSGMALHLVGVLVAGGLTEGRAVLLASLIGPVQVGIRAVQIGISNWWRPTLWAIFGATLLPLGALCFLLGMMADGQTLCFAVVFCVLVGMSNGLMVVARAAVPLEVFGASRYGTWTGRLGASQNVATAVTPLAFALALGQGGAIAALLLAFASASLSLAALLRLYLINR